MRPDYDGIKYYGKNDMSIGWALENSEVRLQGFSAESKVENVNEAIELFNIAQLLDTGVCLRKWDENTYCQTAHCGRCKLHFVFGEFTSPIVPYRNLPQAPDGMTADCCSLV